MEGFNFEDCVSKFRFETADEYNILRGLLDRDYEENNSLDVPDEEMEFSDFLDRYAAIYECLDNGEQPISDQQRDALNCYKGRFESEVGEKVDYLVSTVEESEKELVHNSSYDI